MTLLSAGVVLWWVGHFFKRVLPGPREAMGNAGKGVAALIILAGVVLMVIGYRGAGETPVYDPPSWGRYANNLLMLIAIILFGTGSSKSSLRSYMRHPMLLGIIVWAGSHLLVNGDLASIILFGSMVVWGFAEILVINARDKDYVPFEGGSMAGSVRLLIISAVLYVLIGFAHTYLGYWPFS